MKQIKETTLLIKFNNNIEGIYCEKMEVMNKVISKSKLVIIESEFST